MLYLYKKEVFMSGLCCKKCNMKIENPVCGNCKKELKQKTIDAGGKKVQVSECPSGCGKIKSPQCCGQDMCEK
jgi:hypothetical protein